MHVELGSEAVARSQLERGKRVLGNARGVVVEAAVRVAEAPQVLPGAPALGREGARRHDRARGGEKPRTGEDARLEDLTHRLPAPPRG